MWAKIDGYENYLINKNGLIKRKAGYQAKKDRILKNSISSNGYVQVILCKNGKAKTLRVHRLLSIAFIENPKNKPTVNHIDGNKKNNALENLEWVTDSENMYHAVNVLKRKAPCSMKGRFGKDHNISKSFIIEFPSGEKIEYGSGLEFQRKTGFDHSGISWARRKNLPCYTFSRGNMKGLTVHFELYLPKDGE